MVVPNAQASASLGKPRKYTRGATDHSPGVLVASAGVPTKWYPDKSAVIVAEYAAGLKLQFPAAPLDGAHVPDQPEGTQK